MASTSPIPPTRLSQIATDACTTALANTTTYDHTLCPAQNSTIINSILKALLSETPQPGADTPGSGKYKFAVNSTIIQHLSDPRPAGTEGEGEGEAVRGKVGRRGMHSASGAYWNNERDGMWSFKYEGGETKGMDVVVSVMWISV